MSYRDYQLSIKIAAHSAKLDSDPFYALIMAAARFADNTNQERLLMAFPNQCRELGERYHSGGGILPEDRDDPEFRFGEFDNGGHWQGEE